MENLCRKLERERDQLREWAAQKIQQMPDMSGGIPFAWENLDEQSRSTWRMRADEAASRLAAQNLERKTK
jgi:diaminopimelate decarboxylase